MTVHLIKLAVGVEDLDHLAHLQAARKAMSGKLWHRTRNLPKRRDEILDGGSIYWVIKKVIRARQAIIDIEQVIDGDGRPDCHLILADRLVPVRPRAHRAFQGWRYLPVDDAPIDLTEGEAAAHDDLPEEMAAELRELGLI